MGGKNYDIYIDSKGRLEGFRGWNGFDGHVEIPDGVTAICGYVFNYAYCNVKTVKIPSSVKYIGEQAFSYCESLLEIEIPEGVEIIERLAFCDCHSVKRIKISSTVTSIGSCAFDNCGNVEEIIVAENNPVYHSVNNCLIETKKKLLLRGCRNSIIPTDGSVTVIGDYAFSGSLHPLNNVNPKGVKEIVIPNVITKIGKRAFECNFELESIVIPDSVKTIGEKAFSKCRSLKYVKLGNGLQTIGKEAFYYDTELKIDLEIPQSVTKIEACAFEDSGLLTVNIGANVKIVDKFAFKSCENLKEVTLACGEVGESAFRDCQALEKVIVKETVKSINKFAFCCCSKLKSITLSNGVEAIGDDAFGSCSELENVEIPDSVKYIGDCAFAWCEKLIKIKMPESLEFMGKNVFKESPVTVAAPKKSGIVGFEIATNTLVKYSGTSKDVIIPEGVTKIAAKAFFNKKALESITLPASLTSIENKAIERCANLKRISVASGNTVYKCVNNCLIEIKKKTVILGLKDSVIPADGSVTVIGGEAFARTEVENIVVPAGVKTIGPCAFRYCDKLKSLSLPQTLTTIGKGAFKNCSTLKSLTIPENVASISNEAFQDCKALTEINFNAIKCKDCNKLGKIFAQAGTNDSGITVNFGPKVTAIPEYLFYSHYKDVNIVAVNFAEGSVCEKIRMSAFENCVSLKTISLPDSLTVLGNSAFNGCINLETVNFPKCLTSIASYVFNNCGNIKEIILPNGLEEIGFMTFANCVQAKELFIPKSVTRIMECAFHFCNSLESITVEEGNTEFHCVGNCLIQTNTKTMLRGCFNSIIPADGSVETLEMSAFSGCIKLEELEIPQGVITVYNEAVADCINLKSIKISESVVKFCCTLDSCKSLETITATKELLEKYNYFDLKGKTLGINNRSVEFKLI